MSSPLPTGQSTGLGLAFCKLAIQAHRVKIGFVSQVGAGTTFWFAIPEAIGGTAPVDGTCLFAADLLNCFYEAKFEARVLRPWYLKKEWAASDVVKRAFAGPWLPSTDRMVTLNSK